MNSTRGGEGPSGSIVSVALKCEHDTEVNIVSLIGGGGYKCGTKFTLKMLAVCGYKRYIDHGFAIIRRCISYTLGSNETLPRTKELSACRFDM